MTAGIFSVWFSLFDFSGGLLSGQTQATADLLADHRCFTFGPALYLDSKFQEVLSCTERLSSNVLITWDHFCSVLCAVAVTGS